jgi:hypothetical protein
MRSNYWSCSKFAEWLRGTNKPKAATSRGWRDWEKESQQTHPWRHWLAEEGLDYLQNFIYWPADRLSDMRYYINNRWVSRTHALTAHPRDIKPGTWCDVGNRFLPCMFNELVDFVEIEQAWHHVVWNDEERKKYQTPWWRSGWLRWRTWRCPQSGIAYLRWASELRTDDGSEYTHQAVAAQEVLTLYHWWKDIYPHRPDVHDVSGWSAICERRREKNDGHLGLGLEDETPAERDETRRALDLSTELEEQYDQEDEEMMIRLIRVRKALWT